MEKERPPWTGRWPGLSITARLHFQAGGPKPNQGGEPFSDMPTLCRGRGRGPSEPQHLLQPAPQPSAGPFSWLGAEKLPAGAFRIPARPAQWSLSLHFLCLVLFTLFVRIGAPSLQGCKLLAAERGSPQSSGGPLTACHPVGSHLPLQKCSLTSVFPTTFLRFAWFGEPVFPRPPDFVAVPRFPPRLMKFSRQKGVCCRYLSILYEPACPPSSHCLHNGNFSPKFTVL